MRNYVQVIAVIARDTATLLPAAGAFVGTQDDANNLQATLSGIYTPPNFDVTQTVYWCELNKNTVAQILTLFTIGTGILNADPLSFIQNSATSPRDDPDWPSSDGPRTSTGKVPSAKGPKGHINLSLALYLTLLWQTYLSERKYSVANQVLTELNLWMNNKVTQAEVLDFLSKLPATQ